MKKWPLLLTVFAALLLPACETAAVAVATPILVQKRHVNLVNATYASADNLSTQTTRRIDKNAPFIVRDLEEIRHTSKESNDGLPQQEIHENPNLGKAITNRLTERFHQLGFNVVDEASPVKNGTELVGIYDVYGGNFFGYERNLKVTLQLRDIATGRIISRDDFIIPITDEVREYMDSRNTMMPKIFRD